ncbi:hypothetical protein [Variovorax sp. 38R]|uniref:hypothetical protein n=1 Tax=Variovorax sp. 38R TaxID=2774875 RepID=UPI001781E3A2|nr:hypothetical protein [Variovorax sp. 38R]QOF77543.1 hypothetical protein IG196_24850 [Variovorax sp. 38R]
MIDADAYDFGPYSSCAVQKRRSLKTAITVIAFGIALVLIAALPPSVPAESPPETSAAASQA